MIDPIATAWREINGCAPPAAICREEPRGKRDGERMPRVRISWTPEREAIVRAEYGPAVIAGEVGELAERLGVTRLQLVNCASRIGVTSHANAALARARLREQRK